MVLIKKKCIFFCILILLFINSCKNEKEINEYQISNRNLVQAYVDTVLNNIYATMGRRNYSLVHDSINNKRINSTIYFSYSNATHGTDYKLIIDDSSKKIYNIPKSHPNFLIFINEELQLRLLEKNYFFQPSYQEDLTFSDLELFLNDNSNFRNKFPEKEILDSIISAGGSSFSFGQRILLPSQIDSFFEEVLLSAKESSAYRIKYGEPDISKKVRQLEVYIQKIKPLLKEKLNSKFVLMYAYGGITYLEINQNNNFEYKIQWDNLQNRTMLKDGKFDSLLYKMVFEREFFGSAFGKQSIYKITAFKIGYNLYHF